MPVAPPLPEEPPEATGQCANLTEWVDIDSPLSACNTTSERDGLQHVLVFSDEFERAGRTFQDGDDPRWTAIELAPTTNEQVNYYNKSHAETAGGNLEILSTSQDVTFDTFGGYGENATTETRSLQTAMVQGWDKFCFSEGIAEIRAQMPGQWDQEGLWPAFWLMGNLGRATYTASTEGLWPWIFDECVESTCANTTCVDTMTSENMTCVNTTCTDACDANQCLSQKISKCDGDPGYGLHPHQGRGAPEIDVVEVQPGAAELDFDPDDAWRGGACSAYDVPYMDSVLMTQPFVSTSLQAAPGFPYGSDQRPKKSCLPEYFELLDGESHLFSVLQEWSQGQVPQSTEPVRFSTLPSAEHGSITWYPEHGSFRRGDKWYKFRPSEAPTDGRLPAGTYEMQWYPELDIEHYGSSPSTVYHVGANYEFWGDEFNEYFGGFLHSDAYSANTALAATHWESMHTYRVEWRAGDHGFMRWSLDGKLQFQLEASMVTTPRTVSFDGEYKATMRPRQMPTEPMYMMLNVDSSPRWGWPSHVNCTDERVRLGCECCYDCKRLECTRCMELRENEQEVVDGKIENVTRLVNIREWLADLCDTLPAVYKIDYARVWQQPGGIDVGCDPVDYPTRHWIDAHQDAYKLPTDNAPLKAVLPGGTPCASDDDCGDGTCASDGCECKPGWTGPRCLSLEAGDSAVCREMEQIARAARRSAEQGRYTLAGVSAVDDGVCVPPPAYNETWLRLLITTLCDDGWMSAAADRGLAGVCQQVNTNATFSVAAGNLSRCSVYAGAHLVLSTHFAIGGHAQCCNMVGIDDDGVYLACRRGGAAEWLLLLPAVLACGCCLTFARGACTANRRPPRQLLVSHSEHADGDKVDREDATIAAEEARMYRQQLPELLLLHASEAARQERRELMERLAERIGFQQDNVDNQLEHLESLLLSHLSIEGGNRDAAIASLHKSLLQPWQRWREHTGGGQQANKSTHGLKPYVGLKKRRQQTQPAWRMQDAKAEMQEIGLYLLVWGEAANLRFMPEMLFLLFELARAHVMGGEAVGSVREDAVGHHAFMHEVVMPVYNAVFRETFAGLDDKGRPLPLQQHRMEPYPKNYDDWNEGCWKYDSISLLRTKTTGKVLMDAPPAARWPLLRDCDWTVFFVACKKTHKEQRWWYCLLASNRRIYLVHALSFLCVMMTIVRDYPAFSYNGWYAFRLAPAALLLAPASSMLGCSFEAWACTEARTKAKLRNAALLCLILASCSVLIVIVQIQMSYTEFEEASLWSMRPMMLTVSALVMLVAGVPALVMELLPQTAPPGAFDAHMLFERRTRALLRQPWTQRPGVALRSEVTELLTMYTFWALVWGSKLVFAAFFMMPSLFKAHAALQDAWPAHILYELSDPDVKKAYFSLQLEPAALLRYWLSVGMWLCGAAAFLADTILWYQLVMGFWGGFNGLRLYGVGRGEREKGWRRVDVEAMRENAEQKLLPALGPDQAERSWRVLWREVILDLYRNDLLTGEEKGRFAEDGGEKQLLVCPPRSVEARRRLDFFARSLANPELPTSAGVLAVPGLTVLVPHYAETILLSLEELTTAANNDKDKSNSPRSPRSASTRGSTTATSVEGSAPKDEVSPQIAKRGFSFSPKGLTSPTFARAISAHAGRTAQTDELHASIMGYLVRYFDDDWQAFIERMKVTRLGASAETHQLELRKWASMRLQTLYRTLAGMMRGRMAMSLMLRQEQPQLSEVELSQLLDSKFTAIAALQRYAVMSNAELADVEVLFAEFPSLQVAYIEERDLTHALGGTKSTKDLDCGGVAASARSDRSAQTPRGAASERTFYSCVVDGTCDFAPATGRRLPKYRIRLPGHPILGNGKSDNQNHAIVFSRGAILQAIDANQEGYLEEGLKLPCALREFDSRVAGATNGPAIVGFREHIFSNLGSLGEFAASSEFVFGTLVQRTMASPLWSRYHYGHPDMMVKASMMAQGGISKATRGLNLSEDVFAGMDAMLRGQTVVHREYYQVGKGRDMGFLSILGFFCKLSCGTAQMSTSRQAWRLGERLGLARLFGFFYGHTGYYLGQLHFYHAAYIPFALAYVAAVAEGTGVFPKAADATIALVQQVYSVVFVLFFLGSLYPLSVALLAERGPRAALLTPLKNVLCGSFLFFVLQARCIGHYFSGEFAMGGAAYIPTGRSLAIQHQPFHTLYASFASSCTYPGLELAFFLVALPIACPTIELQFWSYFWPWITPIALLFGPTLFNPRAFEIRVALADVRLWARWLLDGGSKGFLLGFHRPMVFKKASVRAHSFVLPSKELLVAAPLLLVVREAMVPYGWGWVRVALLALPVLHYAAAAVLLVGWRLVCAAGKGVVRAKLSTDPPHAARLIVAIAAACAGVVAGEAMLFVPSDLPSTHTIALIGARYFAWRFTANVGSYMHAAFPRKAGDDGLGFTGSLSLVYGLCSVLDEALGLTIAALALLSDALIGLAIQLLLLSLACVPVLSDGLHFLCLFGTRRTTLSRGIVAQGDDRAYLHDNERGTAGSSENYESEQGTSIASAAVGHARSGAERGTPVDLYVGNAKRSSKAPAAPRTSNELSIDLDFEVQMSPALSPPRGGAGDSGKAPGFSSRATTVRQSRALPDTGELQTEGAAQLDRFFSEVGGAPLLPHHASFVSKSGKLKPPPALKSVSSKPLI